MFLVVFSSRFLPLFRYTHHGLLQSPMYAVRKCTVYLFKWYQPGPLTITVFTVV